MLCLCCKGRWCCVCVVRGGGVVCVVRGGGVVSSIQSSDVRSAAAYIDNIMLNEKEVVVYLPEQDIECVGSVS